MVIRNLADTIDEVRSGIIRIAIIRDREEVASGSGFLSNGLLMSNSHVIRRQAFDTIEITFGDQESNPVRPVRISRDDLLGRIRDESGENGFDYVVLDLSSESEFAGRYEFTLQPAGGGEALKGIEPTQFARSLQVQEVAG